MADGWFIWELMKSVNWYIILFKKMHINNILKGTSIMETDGIIF